MAPYSGGGIVADARQGPKSPNARRKATQSHDGASACEKVASAGVVAEARPGRHDSPVLGRRQGLPPLETG